MIALKTRSDHHNVANMEIIPIKNKSILYRRKEKDGYISITDPTTQYPSYLLLNNTAQFVYDQIDGQKDVSQIMDKVINYYNIKHSKEVELDVSRILLYMWEKQLIFWKNGVFPKMEEYS